MDRTLAKLLYTKYGIPVSFLHSLLIKFYICVGSSYDNEELLQFCSEPCLKELSCGHRCSGTCGECLQGRIHKVCDEDCNNTLICGHRYGPFNKTFGIY